MRRAVWMATGGYVVAFVVWRSLVASPFYERIWLLELSEVFAVWSLLPLPILLVAALLVRSRLVWLALLLPGVWFGREYGTLFLPEFASPAQADVVGTAVRVLTFNTWRQRDDGSFAAEVAQWQPDFVALQEVGPGMLRDVEAVSTYLPYQESTVIRSSTRVALLSKWPITSYVVDEDWEGCHCSQFLVDWQGQVVRVIVVHLRAPNIGLRGQYSRTGRTVGFDTSAQQANMSVLLAEIAARREPTIILGDFNTTERQQGYLWLEAAGLQNAHAEAGWGLGLTYPAPRMRLAWLPISVIRIDHVFYDGAWKATDAWNAPLMGSDHQALWADLKWMGQ